MDEVSTVSKEIFLGTGNGVFETGDVRSLFVRVTLASIEGTGDELRIHGRIEPALPDSTFVDEVVKAALSTRSIVPGRFDLSDDLSDHFVRKLLYVWDQWSGNAHRRGCEHQHRLGWRGDVGMGRPCPFCGHRYDSGPRYEPLPYDVVEFVETTVFGMVQPDEVIVKTLEGEAIPLSQARKRVLSRVDARIAAAKHALIEGEDYVVLEAGDAVERHRLTMGGLRKLAEAGDVSANARLADVERFGWQQGDVEIVEEGEGRKN